jgi:hypothetical protein
VTNFSLLPHLAKHENIYIVNFFYNLHSSLRSEARAARPRGSSSNPGTSYRPDLGPEGSFTGSIKRSGGEADHSTSI